MCLIPPSSLLTSNFRSFLFEFGITTTDYTLTISDFNIAQVGFAEGATHMALTYGVLDFDFNHLNYALHLAPPLVLERSYTGSTLILTPWDKIYLSLAALLVVGFF
ncbi:hypothetical protein [Winogradskyella costae]|uniref:hypothetical protein n=1 Tax=Winogradskyella costae TaxID=2697008 RepID=UPI0015CA9230|nr:hypothetical protein [Winogradskyella costae]